MTKFKKYYRQAERDLRILLTHILKTPALRRRAGVSLRGKERVSLELNVDFIDAGAMRAINRKFRKKNKPTDVLSFPAHEVFRKTGNLGEILICVPVLEAQAKELTHAPSQESRVLLVHGLLHLLGFDHERSVKDAQVMQKEERRLLSLFSTPKSRAPSSGLIKRATSAKS